MTRINIIIVLQELHVNHESFISYIKLSGVSYHRRSYIRRESYILKFITVMENNRMLKLLNSKETE